MKIDIHEGQINARDYMLYKCAVDSISNLFIRGHGGTNFNGTDYYDVTVAASKEEIESTIEFLKACLPMLPTDLELYGDTK